MKLEQHVKVGHASPGAFVECVRTEGDYKFDELSIMKIEFAPVGTQVFIEYERRGKRIKNLPPIVIQPGDFARARQEASVGGKLDLEVFAKSAMVARLFAEGSRMWADQNRAIEENFMDDMAFLAEAAAQATEVPHA